MTTILDQPETTSALPGSVPTAEIGVATGLLVSPDFGTSAGVVAPRRLRSVGFVVTGGAEIEAMRPEDPAAEVRALRDRIGSHGLSRQEMARAIGVDRRSLSGFAKGDIRPSRERLEMLRTLGDLVDVVAMERPGRVREALLARRGRLALIDQLTTSGRSILATWRAWVARSEATVTVTPRAAHAEPIWAAAGRALMDGRLSVPPRAHTVRAETTYETDLDQAAAFAEPEVQERAPGLPVIPTADFYGTNAGPMKQGDLLLAGVARLVADDRFTPPAWGRLDAFDVTVTGARHDGGDLLLTSGPGLVMVTSHDCQLDKDWNRRRTALIKAGMSEEEAGAATEGDESLDRAFNASPLIHPEEPGLDRGNLMAGKILGYLPVPASQDGLIPESVVDLSYRVTLDRLDVARVACISDMVRAQLRYALVSLDTLRARALGFEVEAVVGRRIEDVAIPAANPLLVQLKLEDGDTIELLQQPAEPEPGPARTRPPSR